MKKITNEFGKTVYIGATEETPFSPEQFIKADLGDWTDDTLYSLHTNLGSLTVLDRLTGYSDYVHDVETGFTAPNGEFWLASGHQNVIISGVKTLGEAIEWVKERANTCISKE